MIYPSGGDDTEALQAALSAAQANGESLSLSKGPFQVLNLTDAAICLDLTVLTSEAVSDHRRPNIKGDGIGTTVIQNQGPGYAIFVKGSTGVKAHHYLTLSDFSIAGDKGIYAFDSAFLRVRDIATQGCINGMRFDSVLSSSFRDLDIRSCSVGVRVGRNNGFSGFNANTFDKCIFALNGSLAFQGVSSSTNVTFNGCNFEGNGVQGDAYGGAVVFTCDGTEGATGVNFNNCYFENNAGGFDVQIINGGSIYMTHTFIGCNFNRVSSSRFVNNNIQSYGKNRIVFIGCSFQHYGSYPPWSGRPYFLGDGNQIVECYNCHFGSATEKGVLVNK